MKVFFKAGLIAVCFLMLAGCNKHQPASKQKKTT